MRKIGLSLAAVSAVLAIGCAPADVAGDYTVSVTNEENACNFDNWTAGDSQTGIPVEIVQDDGNVTITVQGLTGTFLSFALGTATFAGTVSGNSVSATIIGTVDL